MRLVGMIKELTAMDRAGLFRRLADQYSQLGNINDRTSESFDALATQLEEEQEE